jgi:hypothetical protein
MIAQAAHQSMPTYKFPPAYEVHSLHATGVYKDVPVWIARQVVHEATREVAREGSCIDTTA